MVAILYVAILSAIVSEIRNQYHRERQAYRISVMLMLPASIGFCLLSVLFAIYCSWVSCFFVYGHTLGTLKVV